MAQPTLIAVAQSDFADSGITDETSNSVTWQTGDWVLVFGAVSDNGAGLTLGNPTTAGSGLSFSSPLATVNSADGSNDTRHYLWASQASGNGTGTVVSVTGSGTGGPKSGIMVIVYRGSDGLGTPVILDGSTAKTINVTRTGANSHVAMMMADWAQVGDVTVTATPTGTVQLAIAASGQCDFFGVTFGDQGAAGGPTSYGITDHTGTVDMSGLAVEIKGVAGGGGGGGGARRRRIILCAPN